MEVNTCDSISSIGCPTTNDLNLDLDLLHKPTKPLTSVKQYKNKKLNEGKPLKKSETSTDLTELPKNILDHKLQLDGKSIDRQSTYYKPCEITVVNDDEMERLVRKVISKENKSCNITRPYLLDVMYKEMIMSMNCDQMINGEDANPLTDIMDIKIIDPESSFRWTDSIVHPMRHLEVDELLDTFGRERITTKDTSFSENENKQLLAKRNETKGEPIVCHLFYDLAVDETPFADIQCWFCPICGEKFANFTDLGEHKKNHKRKLVLEKLRIKRNSGRPRKVPNQSENTKRKYQGPNQTESKKRKYQPPNQTEPTQCQYQSKSVAHFNCKRCNKSFAKKILLERHQQTITCSLPFKCTICKKRFTLKNHLEEHIKTHDTTKPHLCVFCGESFKMQSKLKDHWFQHTGIPHFRCRECKEQFSSETDLKRHTKVAHPKIFSCSHCGQQVSSKDALKQHLKWKHTDVWFECTQCSKKFPTETALKYHVETHSEVKLYSCEHCKKLFKTRKSCYNHTLSHKSTQRKHLCPVCGRIFSVRKNMKRHLDLHSSEKKYPCTVCDKRFAQKQSLCKHVSIEHPEEVSDNRPRGVKCPVCDKMVCETLLSDHLNRHEGVKPYQCKICERWYSTKISLYTHGFEHKKKQILDDLELS